MNQLQKAPESLSGYDTVWRRAEITRPEIVKGFTHSVASFAKSLKEFDWNIPRISLVFEVVNVKCSIICATGKARKVVTLKNLQTFTLPARV